MALRSVAVVLQEPVGLFEYAVLDEVFATDRSGDGIEPFDYRVCAEPAGLLAAEHGTSLTATHGLEAAADADLLAVPGTSATPSPAVVRLLRDAVDRGAWVLSVCSGAFTLAAAGILDGRRCTTHWMHAADLAERYPRATVDPDVLYVQDGTVITSAGTAAGIDACLHLVRTELGAGAASRIARRMVVPPHRDGGQRQFIDRPVPTTDAESLGGVLAFMAEHLGEQHSVADLARRASMSPRTFARRFGAETGTTPHQWLTDQRVLRARELLEESDLPVEQVAGEAGFGSAALLRHHFTRSTGLSPTAFRSQHRSPA
ncbi:helix-turn-helix domain-containing protein [Phycicoccus endophyticus]|uniref:Helix-turn-helix domain-containing protein n=1 Tax=Phycicoccus endophyticus TaxID=1690220 RepID=A0A7G9QZA5_9MICO|nr:helix-turn-helix domain-containing protein [Phycicoccus endophyticus]NHI19033.1 helix-turn-helix domain-containing protein [Phycicoccus endophyticus]QNN48680.1 helix-turn-helix domain-containing protein [Phycicoccus endophyticus]GGL32326.1 putative transcription regulator, AraC family protein [Phycicoccus endophyticus]